MASIWLKRFGGKKQHALGLLCLTTVVLVYLMLQMLKDNGALHLAIWWIPPWVISFGYYVLVSVKAEISRKFEKKESDARNN